MDGDGLSRSQKKKKKNPSQIQSADHWRRHAFLKTVVRSCQRDLPRRKGGIQPVHKHRLGHFHPSWNAPGTQVSELQTKLRGENIQFLKIRTRHVNRNFDFNLNFLPPYPFSWFLSCSGASDDESSSFPHQSYSCRSQLIQ